MPDHVEQIKSRLDIVDVISGYIKVQKSGMNFKAQCPFHNEKTPSFYISPERQIWHCFGCSRGGDMFEFVKEMEGVEFPEALRVLAHRAGVQIERGSFDMREKNAKNRMYEICELATKFFRKQLQESNVGKRAYGYLKGRGVQDETMDIYRLGFAPDDWHALGQFLATQGYSEKEIVDAGLAIRKQPSAIYDRFRSRIIFPIFDNNGQTVGFTGRIFQLAAGDRNPAEKEESEPAKYINTPQTLIYDKSRVLYSFAQAKLNMRQTQRCLLVEGNMDALLSYQAGVRNVVATSGTALTSQHLSLLQRYAKTLDFCFDADQAGAMATRRGIGLALGRNFEVNIVRITDPTCKDPADYVRTYGERWGQVVAEAKPALQFYFDSVRASYQSSSPESKKSVIAVLAPLIRRLASRVEQSHWVTQIAALLRVREEAVQADIATAVDDIGAYDNEPHDSREAVQPVPRVPVTDVMGQALLSIVLRDPKYFGQEASQVNRDLLQPETREIFEHIAALYEEDAEHMSFNALLERVGAEKANHLEFAYLKSQELWKGFSDDDLQTEFRTLVRRIHQQAIAEKLASLEFDIKTAESENNQGKITELMARATALTQELSQLAG